MSLAICSSLSHVWVTSVCESGSDTPFPPSSCSPLISHTESGLMHIMLRVTHPEPCMSVHKTVCVNACYVNMCVSLCLHEEHPLRLILASNMSLSACLSFVAGKRVCLSLCSPDAAGGAERLRL